MKISPTWLGIVGLMILGFIAYSAFTSNQQEKVVQEKVNELKMLRNNWKNLIRCDRGNYRAYSLGGNPNFQIPVQNNSDYVIDKITMSVSFIKDAGGVYKTEQVSLDNIPPHSVKYAVGPKSSRGTSVDIEMVEIFSRGMEFCYPRGNGDPFDPYYCK